ncbi:hypothetical protein [Kingella oralis]|uniref:hypothetical protein n=1 Tax=Kingella oralis TaxID=505 RepID=UPI002D811166|nr:hypothetical protein [Kingella oralis]
MAGKAANKRQPESKKIVFRLPHYFPTIEQATSLSTVITTPQRQPEKPPSPIFRLPLC